MRAGALAALERARKLDPAVRRDLRRDRRLLLPAEPPDGGRRRGGAGVEARQGQRRGAQHSWHRVLGVGRRRRAATRRARRRRRRATAAIEHLTAILNTPLMATNPNLQMTLGRLQLRAGKADLAVPILEKVAQQAPWAAEPLLLLYEAQIAQGKLRRRSSRWCRRRKSIRATFRSSGSSTSGVGKWPDAAAAYEQAIAELAPAEPRSADSIRGGVDQHGWRRREGARRAAGVAQDAARTTRACCTCCRPPNAPRATTQAAEATARKIIALDPTSVAGLRALVAVLFDRFDYKQIVDVVTPLVKEPSRAKGREFEGAAVLVQLGIAQQQLAQWDASIAAFTAAKIADAGRSRDRCLSRAGQSDGAAFRSRRSGGARSARARSRSAAHGAAARAGAAEGRQDRRSQQAPRRRRCEAAREPRVRGRPRRSLCRSKAHRRCAALARAGAQDVWRRRGADDAHGQRLRSRRPARRGGKGIAPADGRGSAERRRDELAELHAGRTRPAAA